MKKQNEALIKKVDVLTQDNITMKGIMTNPKLEFLKDRTEQEIDKETGKVKSIYVYRSKYPTAIRNIKVRLTFDKELSKVNVSMPGTLPFTDNLKSAFHSTEKYVICSAQQIGEGGEMIIEVFSDEPINIVSNEFSP